VYRIVTGWYPSMSSAEKVFDHVRGKVNHVSIIEEGKSKIVVLEYNADLSDIISHRNQYLKKGICCGIEVCV